MINKDTRHRYQISLSKYSCFSYMLVFNNFINSLNISKINKVVNTCSGT